MILMFVCFQRNTKQMKNAEHCTNCFGSLPSDARECPPLKYMSLYEPNGILSYFLVTSYGNRIGVEGKLVQNAHGKAVNHLDS